jgi:predicted ATPase
MSTLLHRSERVAPHLETHYFNAVSLSREEAMPAERYPFSVQAVRQMGCLELHPKVTFFVGENGSGKSTLLESIADKMGFSLQGGGRNRNPVGDGYQTELATFLTLSRTKNRPMDGFFLRAESYYNHATELDELERTPFCAGALRSYGDKSLHEQSHGEAFFATLVHRLGGHGVYLFDEPEAALSPQRQLSMLVRLHDLAQDYSQFIIATHSPFLLAYPHAWIYQFSSCGIQRVAYEDTQHYQLTANFMRNPRAMMQRLLGELGLGG